MNSNSGTIRAFMPENWSKGVKTIMPRGYKTLFMLNSAEAEIYPAHQC